MFEYVSKMRQYFNMFQNASMFQNIGYQPCLSCHWFLWWLCGRDDVCGWCLWLRWWSLVLRVLAEQCYDGSSHDCMRCLFSIQHEIAIHDLWPHCWNRVNSRTCGILHYLALEAFELEPTDSHPASISTRGERHVAALATLSSSETLSLSGGNKKYKAATISELVSEAPPLRSLLGDPAFDLPSSTRCTS